MPPGSTVLVQCGADGIYSQPALTFTGSGAAGKPIKFIGENGVRITGTRTNQAPPAWILVPGRRYTYQLTGTRWRSSQPCPRNGPRSPTGGRSGSRTGGRRSRRRRADASTSGFRPLYSARELDQ